MALQLDLKARTTPSPSKEVVYKGNPCEFLIYPPQKFICSICTHLATDPHLTACCGHEFCEDCLKKWEKMSPTLSCPHCRESNYVHILDKQAKREIEELRVACPKRAQGCTWEGELGVVKSHTKDCSFTPVKCHQCSSDVQRKNLQQHLARDCPLRESTCTYCGRTDTHFRVISLTHLSQCPGYPMDCPNHCGAKGIKRSDVLTHRGNCPNEEIECPLKGSGCTAKMLRRDLEMHAQSSQGTHLMQLMLAFQEMQEHLKQQSKELKELRMFRASTEATMTGIASGLDQLLDTSLTTQVAPLRSIRSLINNKPLLLDSEHRELTLTLPNYSHFEKNTNPKWESQPFYVQGGYKMSLNIFSSTAKDIGAELRLWPGEFDSELQWPCSIKFSYLYLSALKSESTATVTPDSVSQHCLGVDGQRCAPSVRSSHAVLRQLVWHAPKFMTLLPPYPSAIRKMYLHNDCLVFKLVWDEKAKDGASSHVFNVSSLHHNLPQPGLTKASPATETASQGSQERPQVLFAFASPTQKPEGVNVFRRARRRKS